jgi:predicted transcriptional regulator
MLIDFIGHPKLGDHYINNRRYSELLKFATSGGLDRDNIIFVSNTKGDMLSETLDMLKTAGFDILYTQSNESIDDIVNKIEDLKDWDIKEYNTQAIIGGCNLGGCVINAKPMSAVFWQLKGYKTTIHLPLCAEYEQPGTNAVEKVYRSIEQLFHFTKQYKAFGIEYCTDFHRLKMTYKEA